MSRNTKLDPWVEDLLVDPLNKDPLIFDDSASVKSSYGRKYEIVDNVLDMRVHGAMVTGDQRLWLEGQVHYEQWLKDVGSRNIDQDYAKERALDQPVYDVLNVSGRVLDVGGGDGRIRAYVDNDTYVCCDPFLSIPSVNTENTDLANVYPFINDPFNFVCCYSEHLPFKSSSFDVVHMRSCIDHFLNPVLALNEAYRVLSDNGSIVVGMYVEGGKSGKHGRFKETIKEFLSSIGISRFKDYHVWHPTYSELINLIEQSGFSLDKEHWQEGFQDRVVYVQCKKIS